MSALDAFLATWTTARATFGSGEPQTGEQFDGSRQLEELRAAVHTAAPGGHWSGGAATAYDGKNTGHAGVIGRLAGLDIQLGPYVTESATVVSAGRKNLDTIRSWVLADLVGNSTGPMVNLRSTTTSATVESLSHPLTPAAGILTSTSESRCPLQSSARRQVRRAAPPLPGVTHF